MGWWNLGIGNGWKEEPLLRCRDGINQLFGNGVIGPEGKPRAALDWLFTSDNGTHEHGVAKQQLQDDDWIRYGAAEKINKGMYVFNPTGKRTMLTEGSTIVVGRTWCFQEAKIWSTPIFPNWEAPAEMDQKAVVGGGRFR